MSSNDAYGTTPFNRNERLTAAKLETMRQGNQGNIQIRNPDNYVRRLPGGHIITQKRRRQSSGGTSLVYFEITGNTDKNTYTGTIYDNPVDRTDGTKITGVTFKAIQHDFGTLPNTDTGKGYFSWLSGGVQYFQPSIFAGT